jgi:peptide/nickel transport system permease protein
MRRRTALWTGLVGLAVIHLLILAAGFFAPYDPAEQARPFAYMPPMKIHLRDANAKWQQPFVYGIREDEQTGDYGEDESHKYPLRFFVDGSTYSIAGLFQSRIHLFGIDAPGRIALMGTDAYGRDQLSRTLYGGQISLLAGLLATIVSLLLGTAVGLIAGFYGGWMDDGLMRLAELFLALPWLYLLFAVRALLPLSISPQRAFLMIIAVIGVIGWVRPARLVRGIVLSAKERKYVLAARGFGASDFYLVRRHLLPQTYGVLVTQATLLVPQFILAEVTLSFLGLGIAEPVPSWGNLLASLQQYHVMVSYWWMFLPAIALALVFMSYFAVANALENA